MTRRKRTAGSVSGGARGFSAPAREKTERASADAPKRRWREGGQPSETGESRGSSALSARSAVKRGHKWLLLAHQLPTKSSNARVKTWRRLQQLGAVPMRNSVYVLPNTDQCREDFEWMRSEIVALGGEATVFAADAVDATGDDDVQAAFRQARELDYVELARESRRSAKGAKAQRRSSHRGAASGGGEPDGERTRVINRLNERLAAIRRIDFFHAPAGEAAADAVAALERRLAVKTPEAKERTMPVAPKEFMNRRWVTRPRPGVDRMASAWLIRRFIDPKATFGFVERPAASDVPFDMYSGDFSHHGKLCTFEVLAQRFGVTDPTVDRLARIVHDLDMKENRYSAPEAPAVGRLVEGLRQLHAEDATLLEQGMTMFEAFARSFESTKHTLTKHTKETRLTKLTKKTGPTKHTKKRNRP